MNGLWALLGILVIIGVGIRYLLKMKVSQEELEQYRKASQIRSEVDEAVAQKEQEHKKTLSSASDMRRAARMWNNDSSET